MIFFFLQVFPSLLVAGFGLLTAGMLLDAVQVSIGQTINSCASCPKYRVAKVTCPTTITAILKQLVNTLMCMNRKVI